MIPTPAPDKFHRYSGKDAKFAGEYARGGAVKRGGARWKNEHMLTRVDDDTAPNWIGTTNEDQANKINSMGTSPTVMQPSGMTMNPDGSPGKPAGYIRDTSPVVLSGDGTSDTHPLQ